MNEDRDDYLYGEASTEEDQPIDSQSANRTEERLEERRLDAEEKDKDRKEKRYFSAVWLVIGCLGFLGAIYISETIMRVVFNQSDPEIAKSIIEIVKALLFTLSGYLFAKKENGD